MIYGRVRRLFSFEDPQDLIAIEFNRSDIEGRSARGRKVNVVNELAGRLNHPSRLTTAIGWPQDLATESAYLRSPKMLAT
jgi:hypothetical protein